MEQSDPRHLLVQVARILDQLQIPYAVTGGIAVVVWGRPRFTADIDVVVALQGEHVDALARALRGLGEGGYVDESAAREALRQHGEFNYIDPATGVKVDFWIPEDATYEHSRLRRRVACEILGHKVYFVSPEDLILSKLQWRRQSGSDRQLEDVESVLKISGDQLDYSYLEAWARKLGVFDLLQQVRKERQS